MMILLRSKHVGVPLNIFMYFNIEINILDWYSVECEKVHVLVFINYWTVRTELSLFRNSDGDGSKGSLLINESIKPMEFTQTAPSHVFHLPV